MVQDGSWDGGAAYRRSMSLNRRSSLYSAHTAQVSASAAASASAFPGHPVHESPTAARAAPARFRAWRRPSRSLAAIGKRYTASAGFALWVRLLLTTGGQLLAAWLWSPAMLIIDPISATYTVSVYPFVFALLLAIQLLLLFSRVLGLDDVARRWSKEHNAGFSLANWGNAPHLAAPVSVPVMRRARRVLALQDRRSPDADADAAPPRPLPPRPAIVKVFDVDAAQGLLLMASLVYERSDDLIRQMAEAPTDEAARALLWRSEERIHRVAREWDMTFESLSEMKTAGGPFAGLFLPTADEPWMVLAFKGTTPDNYSEWLLDSTFGKTNANVFLDGQVHEGFYRSLFPDVDDPESPYGRIIGAIKDTAAEKRERLGRPINLWLTGHSLGSALASLMYARLLKSPEDLGPDVVLRHGYVYGTPRLGDATFCSKVASDTVTPLTRDSILWRVANNQDIIARVPPGLGDESRLQGISTSSLLNYGHVGAGMHLTAQQPPLYLWPAKKPYEIDTRFFIGAGVRIVAAPRRADPASSAPAPAPAPARTPIDRALDLLPALIDDHLCYQYFRGLERLVPVALGVGPPVIN